MRRKSSLKYLLGTLFVLLAFFLASPASFQSGIFQTPPAHAGFFDDDLDIFDEVLELVADNYVYPPDFKKLFTAATDAMVKTAEKENLTVTSTQSGKTLEANGKKFSYQLSFNKDKNMQALQGIYDFVSREYKGKISKKDLEKAGVNGLMGSLDPYSLYMDKEEFEASMRDTEGQYGGVGMVITLVDNRLTVVRVIKGSPSDRAGILPDDIITRVDKQEIKGMQIHELAAKLRGYPNTQVDIDVYRPSTKVTQLTTLTREIISIETVQYKYLGDQTGYIRISSFSKKTNDQLENAFEKAEQDGVQAFVLDLRDNPGGLL
ncbi:MAG: S41 family peptidase, partial [Nitrospinota bacterium]|nr:S41 family peptidase [Nitrospinota bacterium]